MLGCILWVGFETLNFDMLVYGSQFFLITATQYVVKSGLPDSLSLAVMLVTCMEEVPSLNHSQDACNPSCCYCVFTHSFLAHSERMSLRWTMTTFLHILYDSLFTNYCTGASLA